MFKVRIKFEKNEYSAYISHLDLMNTLQRSLVRAKLPVRYTEGFNPHIYLSILVPLSTGYQSQCELADFDLTTDTLPEDLESRLNGVLPHGLRVLEVGQASRPVNQIAFCGYEVHYASPWDESIPSLFQGEVKILKHSKRGDREVVLGDYVRSLEFFPEEEGFCCRCVLRAGDDPLNPSYITDILRFHDKIKREDRPLYVRQSILDGEGKDFFQTGKGE